MSSSGPGLSLEYFDIFYFFPHGLAPDNPDCRRDCQGGQKGERWSLPRAGLQHGADKTDEEHRHVEQAEGQETSIEGDQHLKIREKNKTQADGDKPVNL